jgi:Fe-S-cluster containining protein
MTGKIDRNQREALARQDAPFLAIGLVPGDPRSFEAHLRQAARLIGMRQISGSPSARLVRHVAELFESSVPPAARDQLACRSGCAFCCHQPVKVNAAEAFFLATQLRERPDTAAAVREAAHQLAARDAETPRVAWLRCPLLDQADGCSVHKARPLACHGYVSLDVEDCKTSYPQADPQTPAWSVREPAIYGDLRSSWHLILQAALRLNGLPDTNYELNAALTLVLDTEDAEKRWLRGENIFASLKPLSPNKPQIEQVLALIAARIGPTL